jgi:hypothetical protein
VALSDIFKSAREKCICRIFENVSRKRSVRLKAGRISDLDRTALVTLTRSLACFDYFDKVKLG